MECDDFIMLESVLFAKIPEAGAARIQDDGNDGKNLYILEECAGPAPLMFAIIGPPYLVRYSMMSRFGFDDKKIKKNDTLRRIPQLNRPIITAFADGKWLRWRQLMAGLGFCLDNDPVMVQPAPSTRRLDLTTSEYFHLRNAKKYIVNSTIGNGSSGVEGTMSGIAKMNNSSQRSVFSPAVSRAGSHIKTHPILFSFEVLGGIASVASIAAVPILGAVGFAAAGSVAGSIAVAWQASMGLVRAGSIFAWCQSAAMGGAAVGGIVATGLAGAGVAVGAGVAAAMDEVVDLYDLPSLKKIFFGSLEA